MLHILNFQVKKEGAAQFGERLKRTMQEAEEVMKRALWTSNKFFNRSIRPTTHFSTGDLVYIEGTNIKMTRPSNKLAQCWYGLFEVLHQMNKTSYELKLLDTWCLKHLPIAPPHSPMIIFFVVGEQVCALILLYLLA